MSSLEELIEKAKAWMDQDPDPETRAELLVLIETQDEAALESRFGSRLDFGTAGLRGELGAGPNRMNRVLVAQAAAGIANFITKNPDGPNPSVVIGFDARKNSDVFAKDSAAITAGAGIKTYIFDSLVATPILAFAVRNLNTSMGIMVTASHNPPRDNGYKVYQGRALQGSQIVSPTDSLIATEISEIARNSNFSNLPKSRDYEPVSDSVIEKYLDETAKLYQGEPQTNNVKIVYSALHGVGASFINRLFQKVGLGKPTPVVAQNEPDGNFPTVVFPNPEEPGAMDLSFETGRITGAELILVNDPDADRLAVAIADESLESGFRQLTGDQVGLILGEEMARRARAKNITGNLSCSIVSSSALRKVAEHYGLGFQETLTGFKWISKVPNLIFGYEEALGYCVDPSSVRDKDGISAALVIAEIAGRLKSEGLTIANLLDELALRYGHYATGQISIRVQDLTIISNLMKKLREKTPQEIAGQKVRFTDLAIASEFLAATDGVKLDLANGARIIVRPSGTEPKLKCYLQATATNKEDANAQLAEIDSAMREILR
jgi:phosphomannomutase